MDDFEPDFSEVDFLPGVDLFLWVRLVLAALTLVAVVVALTVLQR